MKTSYKLTRSHFRIGEIVILKNRNAGFPAGTILKVTDNIKVKRQGKFWIKAKDERGIERYVQTRFLSKAN